MKIINYFVNKDKYDNNLIGYYKDRAFSIIIIIVMILMLVLFVSNLFTNKIAMAVVVFVIIGGLFSPLFIIKRGKGELAGSIIITFITIIETVSMIVNIKGAIAPYFLMQQFYVFPVLIIGGAMFASRRVMIANFLIIIGSSIYVYIDKVNEIPENVKDISTYGFILFMVTIFMVFALSFLFTRFMNLMIKDLSESSLDFKNQNEIMKKMVNAIKLSSAQIFSASNQLNSISQELTKNTSEQAHEANSIADSMSEMLESINLNSSNAKHTELKSQESSAGLQKSSNVIMQTIELVGEISEKTKIISDIAFQTNILSLNASIEAARAGSHGKGFAVVAQEMGKLAQKSKLESSEIEELSISGKSISQTTAKSLKKSLTEIAEIADLMIQITQASNKQEDKAKLINSSIQNLSTITNRTSSSAEEMSASAEELSAQAEQLNQTISLFKE